MIGKEEIEEYAETHGVVAAVNYFTASLVERARELEQKVDDLEGELASVEAWEDR